MSNEEKQECELMKSLLHESLYIDSEEGERKFWQGHALMEKLVRTKDTEILSELFDLFTEENENGICETLMNEIFQYFTWEQIIAVLRCNFSSLLQTNITRAVQFIGYCLNDGYSKEAREIFNIAKSPKSEEFLTAFEDWYGDRYPAEISVFREDMKKWSTVD